MRPFWKERRHDEQGDATIVAISIAMILASMLVVATSVVLAGLVRSQNSRDIAFFDIASKHAVGEALATLNNPDNRVEPKNKIDDYVGQINETCGSIEDRTNIQWCWWIEPDGYDEERKEWRYLLQTVGFREDRSSPSAKHESTWLYARSVNGGLAEGEDDDIEILPTRDSVFMPGLYTAGGMSFANTVGVDQYRFNVVNSVLGTPQDPNFHFYVNGAVNLNSNFALPPTNMAGGGHVLHLSPSGTCNVYACTNFSFGSNFETLNLALIPQWKNEVCTAENTIIRSSGQQIVEYLDVPPVDANGNRSICIEFQGTGALGKSVSEPLELRGLEDSPVTEENPLDIYVKAAPYFGGVTIRDSQQKTPEDALKYRIFSESNVNVQTPFIGMIASQGSCTFNSNVTGSAACSGISFSATPKIIAFDEGIKDLTREPSIADDEFLWFVRDPNATIIEDG